MAAAKIHETESSHLWKAIDKLADKVEKQSEEISENSKAVVRLATEMTGTVDYLKELYERQQHQIDFINKFVVYGSISAGATIVIAVVLHYFKILL